MSKLEEILDNDILNKEDLTILCIVLIGLNADLKKMANTKINIMIFLLFIVVCISCILVKLSLF